MVQPLPVTEMILPAKKQFFLLLFLTLIFIRLDAQKASNSQFVNPWIGTSTTKTPSLWGNEGGTYPGAVAPFGFVQLTPETRNGDSKGYNYNDNSILYFSCINHPTGYPDGSSGRIQVMPVNGGQDFKAGTYSRTFKHEDETATPGFYSVLFRDNGTLVEVTAAEHSGMFRFTFPPHVKPRIFLGDLGKIETATKRMVIGTRCHSILTFNIDYTDKEEVSDGYILTFPSTEQEDNKLIMNIGVSLVDTESTLKNLEKEAEGRDFDQFKDQNLQKWNKALAVIDVEDSSGTNKTIFYTALYHSMLMPWIISDVNGKYKGADEVVHVSRGKNQYGGFSAWDTFRSLHPLLCLIAPDRQNDMILSVLDHYEQSGKLPAGPMTGNHLIPVIVDSYLKGICGFDKKLAFSAMKSSLVSASASLDFSAYRQIGYVPASCSESVTKTVEFAYDDWALAQFAGKVMGDQDEFTKLLRRSFNYRNLFNPVAMALLPRMGNSFNMEPGNTGYKEGDQWSYSMFVPQDPPDLVNLFGGDIEFAAHLDSSLTKHLILFDNEPVLHVPYLFNYANRPDLTQKWARDLMKTHYFNSPSGLPGNDDHGAMSSWYVFSAMGFYPISPGRPVYDLGSPNFKKVVLHLQNSKKWIINSRNNDANHQFVRNLSLNGQPYKKSWISHLTILQGGELTFEMDKVPAQELYPAYEESSEKIKVPDFQLNGFYQLQKQVTPDQLFFVHFTVQNKGRKGTRIVRLFVDGKEYTRKNLVIDENSAVIDSIGCRLYQVGSRVIRIDQLREHTVEVIQPSDYIQPPIQVLELKSKRILKRNIPFDYSILLQNKGGDKQVATIPVSVDDSVWQQEVVTLEPGEFKKLEKSLVFKSDGIHKIQVGSKVNYIKIYHENADSKVIEIKLNEKENPVIDQSGLFNNCMIHRTADDSTLPISGIRTDPYCFAEIPGSESLDNLDEKITVMAWVKPSPGNSMLSDILTKGDFIALQASGSKSLSWFAGGWGRGSCSADLPFNWINNWHHIAGVADGRYLKVYIDGIESGRVTLDLPVNLSSNAKWMIGRNEEFPDQRFFNGNVDHFKIFVEPLNEKEINREMEKGKIKFDIVLN